MQHVGLVQANEAIETVEGPSVPWGPDAGVPPSDAGVDLADSRLDAGIADAAVAVDLTETNPVTDAGVSEEGPEPSHSSGCGCSLGRAP
jgi:hypothetical protein